MKNKFLNTLGKVYLVYFAILAAGIVVYMLAVKHFKPDYLTVDDEESADEETEE